MLLVYMHDKDCTPSNGDLSFVAIEYGCARCCKRGMLDYSGPAEDVLNSVMLCQNRYLFDE